MYYSNKPHPSLHNQPYPQPSTSYKSKYLQLTSHLQDLQECYSQKVSILQSSLHSSDSKVLQLSSYIEQLDNEMTLKQSEIQQHQSQIQKLLGIIEQLQTIVKDKDTQNHELARENSILKQEGEELQMKLYASQFETQSLRGEIRMKSSEGDDNSLSDEASECKILKDISNQEKIRKKVM